MALFILGDPHLSFSADKPMDIFGARWKNHAERLKAAWEAQVSAADTVVIAGDLSWASSLAEAEQDLEFLHRLPGKKLLLKGNHDYWWETATKMRRFFAERGWEDLDLLYNTAVSVEGFALCGSRGWDADGEGEQNKKILARERQRLEISLQALPPEGERIAIFHYPPGDDYIALLKEYKISRCYFGHIHGPAAAAAKPYCKEGIEFRLISADALDFKPYLILPQGGNGQNRQKWRRFWSKVLLYFKKKC